MVRVFATLRRPPVRRLRLYAQGASSMEMTRQRRSALTQLITNGYAYKPQMHLGRAKSFICIYAFEPCADCCHLVRLSKTGLIHSRCVRWVGAAPWNSGTHNKLPDPATYSEQVLEGISFHSTMFFSRCILLSHLGGQARGKFSTDSVVILVKRKLTQLSLNQSHKNRQFDGTSTT